MADKNQEINKLCEKCIKECKQPYNAMLIACPNFKKKPKQLEFQFKFRKVN
jgi:hypothetical protein